MSVASVGTLPTVMVSLPQSIDHNVEITAAQQMMSSCMGAIVTSLTMTPMDVVKIRLQVQQKPFSKGSYFIYSNGLMDCLCVCSHCNESNGNSGRGVASRIRPWGKNPAHFSGTLDAFSKIIRYEGLSKLWSGLPPTLIQSVPATVVYFTLYDRFKYAFGYDESRPDTKYIPILAGVSARVMAVTLISPLELIRTKMQSATLSYSQLCAAVRFSIANDGMISVMRGLGPSLLRDVPFSAIYWFMYEQCKARHLSESPNTELTFAQSFVSGAVSGTVAAVVTLPFDVIKTHRQIELGEASVSGVHRSPSTWVLIVQLYKHQGFGALYAGIVPRVIKVAPACAIMISSYEFGKRFFRHRNALNDITAD